MISRLPASILLVDDQPANLLALEAVLHELGERLVCAPSGEQALRRLRDEDFAAVLLDVRMPDMDGFETARLIRSQRRSRTTPIIFITADATGLCVEEAYAIGAVDLLTKPLVPAVLKAKVAFFVELHRSRQELQAAERRAVEGRAFLSAVLEEIEDGVVACGADGALTLFNRATREFHGLAHEAPAGTAQWPGQSDLYRPDGKTPMRKEDLPLFRAFAGEAVRNAELVIAPRGGKARVVRASGQPLYDHAGRRLGAVVSMHDVTARREAQAASETAAREQSRREEAEAAAQLIRESRERLRASEERARLATDAAGLGVWVWDVGADRVTWENERMCALLGLAAQDAPMDASRFADEFVHPADAEAFRQALTRAMKTARQLHFEGRFLRRDGVLRWIELTGVLQPRSDGSPLRILGTAADITDRKEADEELRKSEERYRTLFESMDEGFCIVEVLFDEARRPADYRFLEINPAFEKHTGLVGAGGRRMRELVPDHDRHWFEIYGRVAATGEPARFENEAKAMGRWFDVYATRLGGPGSAKVAILFSDITERRRAQQNLQRLAAELAETDRRKTEFLATLAHELRNPLAPISNGLQLMRMAAGNPQVQEKAREMMERQLRHLVRLVDDLLDIARISSGKVELKKERVAFKSVLDSAVESSMPLVSAGGHTLVQRVPDDKLELVADPVRLGQVVSNLLNNAARYTPPGGQIELSVRREAGDVAISVADTGIGIEREALSQVFEMFTQVGRDRHRLQGGLGIGLALVRRLVELHDGSIVAESAGAGQGSRFTVRLPLAGDCASGLPQDAPAAVVQSAARLRVLVVDDNVDAAQSLAALLDLSGHATRVAHDGEQALLAAHEFRPEVVFLDIGMPGKDGYEVAQALRAKPETHEAVLVALTGWGAQDDRARSRSAGFDHHLTKPASLAAVEGLLSKMADSRAQAVR